MIAVALVLALLGAPPNDNDTFVVRRDGDRVLVSANRPAVHCDAALLHLAEALGWTIRFAPPTLQDELAAEVVDLAFHDSGPRTVASLIASAAGADVVFEEPPPGSSGGERLVVVPSPDASTAAGRARLLELAARWYTDWLGEATATAQPHDRVVEVRWKLARTLTELGDDQAAAQAWMRFYHEAPHHEAVPQALLQIARVRFDAGDLEAAERWARELTLGHPARPEAAAGTVLLGRVLLASGRFAECEKTLTGAYLRLAGAPELVDVYLLVGFAQFWQRRFAALAATVRVIESGARPAELGVERAHDLLFLQGAARLHGDDPEGAVAALQRWLTRADPDDDLRGIALVMVGRAYFACGRYLQAMAAAHTARQSQRGFDRHWAAESARLFALTSLTIGDEERAFDELELEVRGDPAADPELTLFLIERLRRHRRFARAVRLAEQLAGRRDDHGDRARFERLHALRDRAARDGSWRSFVETALAAAETILDADRRRAVEAMIGEAWLQLGEPDRAADAFRGVLR